MTGLELDDQQMGEAEQLRNTFQNLSHLWARPQMDLPQPKRTRNGADQTPQEQAVPGANGNDLLHLLAKMVLRQESEIQTVRAQDSYVFHLTVGTSGLLQLLLDQGVAWSKMEEKTANLRSHLFHHLAAETQKRFTLVEQAPPDSATWTQQIILSDGSWPTLHWNHEKMWRPKHQRHP